MGLSKEKGYKKRTCLAHVSENWQPKAIHSCSKN